MVFNTLDHQTLSDKVEHWRGSNLKGGGCRSNIDNNNENIYINKHRMSKFKFPEVFH